MVLHFSSLKRPMPCLTGLNPGLMLRVWSATSLETPGMSTSLHAKTSLLRQKKSVSSPSYFRLKPDPIWMVLDRFSALTWIALVS
jgi:hypothetical protein